jgi:hypothetical protein
MPKLDGKGRSINIGRRNNKSKKSFYLGQIGNFIFVVGEFYGQDWMKAAHLCP